MLGSLVQAPTTTTASQRTTTCHRSGRLRSRRRPFARPRDHGWVVLLPAQGQRAVGCFAGRNPHCTRSSTIDQHSCSTTRRLQCTTLHHGGALQGLAPRQIHRRLSLLLPRSSTWHSPPIPRSCRSFDPSPHCCYTLIIIQCWVGLRATSKSSQCHLFFLPTSDRASLRLCHHPSSPSIAWISKPSNHCSSRCVSHGWRTPTTNTCSPRLLVSLLLRHNWRSNHSPNHSRPASVVQQQRVHPICHPNGVSSITGGQQFLVCDPR